MSVLLDTGILYALLDRADGRHRHAAAFFTHLADGRWGRPATTDLVAAELLNLVRARRRGPALEAAARRILPLPESRLAGLLLIPVGPDRLAQAADLYERHRARGLSFTDASHLAVMEGEGIRHLATFDAAFRGLVGVVPAEGG